MTLFETLLSIFIIAFFYIKEMSSSKMRLWVKHARQVVCVVADDEKPADELIKGFLAGPHQNELAILEERDDGVGLSIIIDQ